MKFIAGINSSGMRILFILLLAFPNCSVFAQPQKSKTPATPKPFVLGTIEEIYSAELGEMRTLNIYVPPSYNAKDATTYPVVYLLDGSADEDFIHVVGLYQFNSFPWVRRAPESIIVGIANIDRKRDFTFPSTVASEKKNFPTTGGSEKFMNFLGKELQPYMQKKYKTNSSKTIIGESLGGLLATEILLKRPAMFTKYIIISPGVWWDGGSLLNYKSQKLNAAFSQPTEVYIGVGKEGLTPSEPPRVMEVDANVLADKIRNINCKNMVVHFDYLPDESHATIAHHALFNALELLYPATDAGK